jgi:DNA-binding PadR family transcriptional regulator
VLASKRKEDDVANPYEESVHRRMHDHVHRGAEREAHRHGDRGRGRSHRGRRGFGPPFEGGRRAGRGDIRAAVLALLEEQPMHGYQIIQELGERSGGAWTPSPGSIYPALQLLQDQGLVTAEERDGKRVFTLTAAGREEAASRGDGPTPWEAVARGESDSYAQLRAGMGQLAVAVHQIAGAATETQVGKAVQVLGTARRELYRLLAEDEESEPGA